MLRRYNSVNHIRRSSRLQYLKVCNQDQKSGHKKGIITSHTDKTCILKSYSIVWRAVPWMHSAESVSVESINGNRNRKFRG